MESRELIGIVSRTEGKGSGAEMVLNYLLAGWKDKASLVVITARGSSVAETAGRYGFRVVELSFTPYKILPNLKEIEAKLKPLKGLTKLHAWNSKSFEISWYMATRLGVPLTCTMHDHPAAKYYKPRKLWLLRTVANRSKGLVTVSNVLKDACIEAGYSCPLPVIQNGLPELSAVMPRSFTDKQLRIGFLGMNSGFKGFELVAGWIRATRDNKKIHWSLYGEVCTDNELLVDGLRKDGIHNFTIEGRQDPIDIFNAIDLLVHTSTSFDCFPTVLLESARSGVPVVASTNGGAVEIVEHGKTGFLFDPLEDRKGLEYILQFGNNPSLLAEFSTRALELYYKRFRIDNMVNGYSSFWKEVC